MLKWKLQPSVVRGGVKFNFFKIISKAIWWIHNGLEQSMRHLYVQWYIFFLTIVIKTKIAMLQYIVEFVLFN